MPETVRPSERGQTLVLFAAALVVMLLITGLVIDGGWAFTQRRSSQNAADFASMAGARILGEYYTKKPDATTGNDANIAAAVAKALAANAATGTARYVNGGGFVAGTVGGGAIPLNAAGVLVEATISWHPFFLGVIGINNWSASATATSMTKGTAAGGVLPVGVEKNAFLSLGPVCDINAGCDPGGLTPGHLTDSAGNFGWLSFGCADYGLGQTSDGCAMSQGFLQNEIGPPGNSHGCCTTVAGDPAPFIGGLTGNLWGDLSYYVTNQIPVWVPIYDVSYDTGSNAYYHIVGFGAVILTSTGDGKNEHAKWIEGVRISDIGDTPNAFGLIGVTGEVYLVH